MANKDPYEIPSDRAESVKSRVGQTMTINGVSIKIESWEGQDYIVRFPDGSQRREKVMYLLDFAHQRGAKWSN